MDDKELGRTGIKVSRIALGCGTFGGIGSPAALIGRGSDGAAAFAAMDDAVALGSTLPTAMPEVRAIASSVVGWLGAHPRSARGSASPQRWAPSYLIRTKQRLSPRRINEQLDISLEWLDIQLC